MVLEVCLQDGEIFWDAWQVWTAEHGSSLGIGLLQKFLPGEGFGKIEVKFGMLSPSLQNCKDQSGECERV